MRTMLVGSTEYLKVTVTADADINGDSVELLVDETLGWLPAEFVTSTATTVTVRLLIGPGAGLVVPAGSRSVLVRITDDPETPIINAGTLTVLNPP